MLTAALYDIHGNLPALEAVLREVEALGVRQIILGGDVVTGPMPRETMDLAMSISPPPICIRGNGDREVLGEIEGHQSRLRPRFRDLSRWIGSQLTASQIAWIKEWHQTYTISDAEHRRTVLYCHATPANDIDIFTRLTDETELLPTFESVTADVVVCGHTHMQFDRSVGRVRVVNAGSVGMPFGGSGAYWLLLGDKIELRRTAYDLASAAARIRASPYPEAEMFAANNILAQPSEEEVLQAFSKRPRT